MANEKQNELPGMEASETGIEATSERIRDAIRTVERWLREYDEQNRTFEDFLLQNDLKMKFEEFKKERGL